MKHINNWVSFIFFYHYYYLFYLLSNLLELDNFYDGHLHDSYNKEPRLLLCLKKKGVPATSLDEEESYGWFLSQHSLTIFFSDQQAKSTLSKPL